MCPRDEIAALLDGELCELDAAEFNSHLDACRVCRQALSDHTRLTAALNAYFTWDRGPNFRPVASPVSW
jgi:anti-sigma factor RsiW